MQSIESFVRGVETLNGWVGKVVAWLALGTVVVCFATVYLRYALNTNFTWLQEAYVWQHAAAIVLGGAYTMMIGGFVRVDIYYGKMTPRGRALVDLYGTLIFLFPFMAVVGWAFWRHFWSAAVSGEGSPNPGGLPAWWLLKGTLVVFVGLIVLQGMVLIGRSLLVLRGRLEFAGQSSH
jgi:TRAP-type mannitol/chloroaromatic compound transport system permease small subunit